MILMTTLRSLRFLLFLSLLIAAARANAQLFDPAARAAVVAPFLDDQTLAVGRIDLSKVDPSDAFKLLAEIIPDKDVAIEKQIAEMTVQTRSALEQLNVAGISELYTVVSLADLPKEPPFVMARVKAGSDPQRAAEVLRKLVRQEAADARAGAAVVGTKATIERLKNLQPTPRPEFAQGFQKAGDTAVQVIFSPNPDTRRVLREMLPRLPDEVGGGSGKMLADGVQWAVLSIDAPPTLAISLTIQSNDADSASALRGMAVSGLALLREAPGVQKVPQLGDVIRVLTPRLSGDQLTITASERDGSAKALLSVFVPALQAARTSAGRSQSTNNLKQLGLAMHNYENTHKRFPPQAIRSKEGKALLSWRVAILPFLDAGNLYKEFHLDEPWDSEHNKRLIEKMPPSFASPALGDSRKAQGMTTYLVPLSRQPPVTFTPPKAPSPGTPPAALPAPEMVFDNPEGIAFFKITDGSSNTIMLLEAHPQAAVVWTKPDDLVIDEIDPFKNLRDQPNDGFNVAYCDGSVRFLKISLDPKTFRFLLLMNDGQRHEVP